MPRGNSNCRIMAFKAFKKLSGKRMARKSRFASTVDRGPVSPGILAALGAAALFGPNCRRHGAHCHRRRGLVDGYRANRFGRISSPLTVL